MDNNMPQKANNNSIIKRLLDYDYSNSGKTIIIMVNLAFIIIFSVNYLVKPATVNRLSYFEKSNLTYEVCLEENDFFESECLGMDRKYIASIIKKININMEYIFRATDKFNYKYKYEIAAELVATDKTDTDKIIYNKSEILSKSKTITKTNSKGYIIKEVVAIDYDKYNEVMKNLKQEYAILFDSKLVVSINIITNGTYSLISDPIKSNQVAKIEIPLSEQTIDIAFNQNEINNDNTLYEAKPTSINRTIAICLLIFALFFESIITFLLVRSFAKEGYARNAFRIEVNKIIKEYDRFISTVQNLPHFENKEVIRVATFQELLDTRECLNKPILYCETVKNKTGYFVIYNDNIIYIYAIEK